MRGFRGVVLMLTMLACGGAPESDPEAPAAQPSGSAIVLTGATLNDGTGRAPLADRAVVVRDDTIAWTSR